MKFTRDSVAVATGLVLGLLAVGLVKPIFDYFITGPFNGWLANLVAG